jgi:hypothetical protein
MNVRERLLRTVGIEPITSETLRDDPYQAVLLHESAKQAILTIRQWADEFYLAFSYDTEKDSRIFRDLVRIEPDMLSKVTLVFLINFPGEDAEKFVPYYFSGIQQNYLPSEGGFLQQFQDSLTELFGNRKNSDQLPGNIKNIVDRLFPAD